MTIALMLFCIALPAVAGPVASQDRTADQRVRHHNWAARSTTGQTLAGTWTYVVDPKTGSASGTWTLDDGRRQSIVRGVWSAAKSPKGWTGAWRAVVSGNKTEYSGTWSAGVTLEKDAGFAELFKAAVKAAVSGQWRAGGQAGGWSIRTFE